MKAQTMKTDHTPGPWTIQHGHSSRVYLINSPRGHAVGEIVYTDTRNPADAQLIAAAPDLLEALLELIAEADAPINWSGHQAPNTEGFQRARAAVYKAIGA